MKFDNPYWSVKLRIGVLQRWILVHSIIYYEMDDSVVSDKEFDENARQLVWLQDLHHDEAKQSQYWYAFKGFDGSTGFDLYSKLTEEDRDYLTLIASRVLHLYKQSKEVNNGVKRKTG